MPTPEHSLAGPSRPLGLPEIPQFHLPSAAKTGSVYSPWLYGAAHIHFADRRRKIDEMRRVAFKVRLASDARAVDWEAAEPLAVHPEDLSQRPSVEAPYLPLPGAARELKTFTRWAKNFDRWLARTQRLALQSDGDDTPLSLAPKRGGVSVDLVAILWELV